MKRPLETVKVKHKDGFMIINKKDFNEKEHELFEVVKKEQKKKKEDKN